MVVGFLKVTIAVTLIAIVTSNVFADEKTKIGVSLPLTGDVAAAGGDVRNALIFANKYFYHDKYNLVFEDDRCENVAGLSAAQRLAIVEKVTVALGFVCNNVLLATAPVYRKSGVTLITSGATTGDSREKFDKAYRLYPADQLSIPPLFKVIASRHKSMAIISDIEAYPELIERTLFTENKSIGEKMKLFADQVDPQLHDYRSSLLKIKQKNPEAIFLNARGEASYIDMVKQMNELKMHIPIYSVILPASPVAQSALGALNNGVVFSNMVFDETTLSTSAKEIYEKLKTEMGEPQSAPILSLVAIDSLRLVDEALKRNVPVSEYLAGVNYPGLIGRLSFDSSGAIEGLNFTVQQIVGGHPKNLIE